ncbi:MAG: metallophosphoesterase [Verrucomicrobia subdivision 3 bacterium]|nr:metallophosphoesterase [Limisphaerales bacterium]
MRPEFNISRRAALQRVGAGSLLALGLWPGTAKGQEGGKFRFVVVNDTHYICEECGAWLGRVMERIRAAKPDFCLVAGDLTELGKPEHLAAVHEVFRQAEVPVHVVIGNHDYASQTDRQGYETTFPGQINYSFAHKGWQFVGLDTSEGMLAENTRVQPATLEWLDRNLRKLDLSKPTVIFTHFPLGTNVKYRPVNADELLERCRDFNLRAVFSGHFHGYTERRKGETLLTTNVCCALKRGNHDNTTQKGYFLCDADGQTVRRRIVQVA